jgi:hypothetical protein
MMQKIEQKAGLEEDSSQSHATELTTNPGEISQKPQGHGV